MDLFDKGSGKRDGKLLIGVTMVTMAMLYRWMDHRRKYVCRVAYKKGVASVVIWCLLQGIGSTCSRALVCDLFLSQGSVAVSHSSRQGTFLCCGCAASQYASFDFAAVVWFGQLTILL